MRGRWLVTDALLIGAVTLVACSSAPGAGRQVPNTARSASALNDVPSRVVSPREPRQRGEGLCGNVPVSSGPLAHLARLEISAPHTASGGRAVQISATITANSATPRVITTPRSSAVLVVRDDRVVSRTRAAASAPQVPLQLSAGAARPAQVIPRSVEMMGCASGTGAADLAPGQYALVALLGYELDSLNAAPDGGTVPPPTGERSFTLVSDAVPITVD